MQDADAGFRMEMWGTSETPGYDAPLKAERNGGISHLNFWGK